MGTERKRTKIEIILLALVTLSIVRQSFLGNYHNIVGAVVFSGVGILYLKQRGKGRLAASLTPQVREESAENV